MITTLYITCTSRLAKCRMFRGRILKNAPRLCSRLATPLRSACNLLKKAMGDSNRAARLDWFFIYLEDCASLPEHSASVKKCTGSLKPGPPGPGRGKKTLKNAPHSCSRSARLLRRQRRWWFQQGCCTGCRGLRAQMRRVAQVERLGNAAWRATGPKNLCQV